MKPDLSCYRGTTVGRCLRAGCLEKYLDMRGMKSRESEGGEMGGACGVRGPMIREYKISAGKHEGNKPLGRHKRRCQDNINMDLVEM
jgi:hypothetical protein